VQRVSKPPLVRTSSGGFSFWSTPSGFFLYHANKNSMAREATPVMTIAATASTVVLAFYFVV
jgi:hypothetical protein